MEIIAIIFVLWLIGCAFPGSSGGSCMGAGEAVGLTLAFILSVAFAYGLFCLIGYAAFGLMYLLGSTNPGVFVLCLMAVIVALGFTNKFIVEAIERRNARRSVPRA